MPEKVFGGVVRPLPTLLLRVLGTLEPHAPLVGSLPSRRVLQVQPHRLRLFHGEVDLDPPIPPVSTPGFCVVLQGAETASMMLKQPSRRAAVTIDGSVETRLGFDVGEDAGSRRHRHTMNPHQIIEDQTRIDNGHYRNSLNTSAFRAIICWNRVDASPAPVWSACW